MRAIQRNTRVKWHNPTGELVNYLTRRIGAYQRYKRIHNK